MLSNVSNEKEQHIVIYHEFNDGDPYPAEIIKIFKGRKETAMKMAEDFLRERFISYFEETPEEYAETEELDVNSGEVIDDDFICVSTSSGLQYFIAEDNSEVVDTDETSDPGSPDSKDMGRAIAETIAEKTAEDYGFNLSDKDMKSYVTDIVYNFIREAVDDLYDTERYAHLIEVTIGAFRVKCDPEYRRLLGLAATASRFDNEYKVDSGSKYRYNLLVDGRLMAVDKGATAIDSMIRGIYFGKTGKVLDV